MIEDDLLSQVRWSIEWRRRNEPNVTEKSIDDEINAMTPLELLTAISDALKRLRND